MKRATPMYSPHNPILRLALTLLVAMFSLLSLGTEAQSTGETGSLRGRVLDASGAAIPSASVVLKSPDVAGVFTATSDADGNYRLLDLPPGAAYALTTEATGFARDQRAGLAVRSGLNLTIDVTLTIGSLSETVTAEVGEIPLIETVSTVQAINISGEAVRSLPLTGRREWSDVLQLTPGIVSASSDAYGGQTYFLRGSENENHSTSIDGVDVGSFGQNWPSNYISLSTEGLGDVQIKTGVADASAPSAMGMVITVATLSGSNTFHGAAAFAYTIKSWNANNTPGGTSPTSDAKQPDFSIGGPIIRDRAWFFGSARYINRNDGISRTSTQLGYLKALSPGFSSFDNQSRGWVWIANSTVNLNPVHKLHFIVQRDSRTQGGNFQNYAGAYAPNQYGGGAYGLRLSSAWTTNLTSNFLVAYNNKGANTDPALFGNVGNGPSISVFSTVNASAGQLLGNGQLAVLNNLPSQTLSPSSKYTISGDLTYFLPGVHVGNHELQAGYYLQPRSRQRNTTIYAGNGFALEEDVLKDPKNLGGGYIPFHRQVVSVPRQVTSYIGSNLYALYAQDVWRATPRLTITGGLRADYVSAQDLLFGVSTQSSWNLDPRIGAAYVLTRDQRNVLRARWGRAHDIPNAGYLGTAGTSRAGITDSYALKLDGNFNAVFTTPASTSVSRNRKIDPDRHQGYVDEWTVGYQTQLPESTTLDASFINRQYKDRPALVDVNGIYEGNVFKGYKDPSQNDIDLVTNNHWNWFVYDGIEFTATKQARHFHLLATYTLAHQHIAGTWQPNDPASFIQPGAFANNAGIGSVRGNNTTSFGADTRERMWETHMLRTGAYYDAPFKIKLATQFTAQSGTPSGPVTTNLAAPDPQFGPATLRVGGRTVSNPLATTLRFAFANRGEGQPYCPWLNIWNARVGRETKLTERVNLELALDVFNVTNNGSGQQFVTGGNQINSNLFGQLTNVQLPRSYQVLARMHF